VQLFARIYTYHIINDGTFGKRKLMLTVKALAVENYVVNKRKQVPSIYPRQLSINTFDTLLEAHFTTSWKRRYN